MMRALAVVVLAVPAIAAAEPKPDARPAGVVERSTLEIAPPGRAFKQIEIDNALGDVRVEGYDGNAIIIETRKRAPDVDALDRLRVSLVPNPDGTVRITTAADGGREAKPVARGAVHIDLIVRAPRGARVDATVAGGALELVDMDGGGELDTASGPIHVRNVLGQVSTHSVTGATALAQVFGSVDAQTMSADVDLDTISGDRLVASANHGRIAGRRVRAREVELTTTEGKIVLEAEAALHGRIVVASLHGDVDVRLHRHAAVVVRARGSKVELGAAATAQPDHWNQATFGTPTTNEPAAVVELRSQYGNVQFAIIE